MADFQGDKVPVAYARLVRFYGKNPEYMRFGEDHAFYPLLSKSSDLLNDGVRDYDSTQYIDRPITGVNGNITATEFDMIEGGLQSALITPAVVPSNTDKTYTFTCISSDEDVATVEAGVDANEGKFVVTAIAEGEATIILGISGTRFKKEFDIEVVDTTE